MQTNKRGLNIYSFLNLVTKSLHGTFRQEKNKRLLLQKVDGLLLYIIREGKRQQIQKVELLLVQLLRLLFWKERPRRRVKLKMLG